MLGDGLIDSLAFGVEVGDGFLAVDILAVAEGLHANESVPVVRSSNHYRIDIVAGAQFAVIKIGLAVLVAIFLVDGFLSPDGSTTPITVGVVLVTVSDGHSLNILVVDVGLHDAKAPVADADKAHDYALAGSGIPVFAEGTGGNDGREADGSAGGC